MIQKTDLRAQYKALRKRLPAHRTASASALSRSLASSSSGRILSYVPIFSELDLTPLNQLLAAQQRLVLPKINSRGALDLYQVLNLQTDLIRTGKGLWEPAPDLCPLITPSEVSLALIPALAFDIDGFRLGYGHGCYDRLLADAPFPSWGIGFREQLHSGLLPVEPWDIPVQSLKLF